MQVVGEQRRIRKEEESKVNEWHFGKTLNHLDSISFDTDENQPRCLLSRVSINVLRVEFSIIAVK